MKNASRQEKIDALVNWHATPEELRSVPTLNQLALQIGAPADGTFYALARSPEVRLKALTIISSSAVIAAPAILDMLLQLAEQGNVKAMLGYLDFILKVALSMSDRPEKRPVEPRHMTEEIHAMWMLCRALGNDPVEAQRRIDAGEIKLKDREERAGAGQEGSAAVGDAV